MENWVWNEEELQFLEVEEREDHHFERAKSLRVEQQKKITNFINAFGLPTKQEMRMYSPQKTKRILKGAKQVQK